jgi:hypothetical protein
MTLEQINEKLETAGCETKVWNGQRIYVNKTPNGSRGQYGYCVAGEDVRDITDAITKRNGEISAILRA